MATTPAVPEPVDRFPPNPETGELERICGFTIHPAASRFPLMSDAELDELAADIKARGLDNPILLHEGQVIDGRNRILACRRAGVFPTYKDWDCRGGSPVGFVLATNVKRRHLTESQRAMLAVELLPDFEAEAKQRQQRALKKGDEKPVGAPVPERGTAASKAAEAAGVSERYVKAAKAVAKKAPALAKDVLDGKKSLKAAEKEIRPPTKKFDRKEAEETARREGDIRLAAEAKVLRELLYEAEHWTTKNFLAAFAKLLGVDGPNSPAARVAERREFDNEGALWSAAKRMEEPELRALVLELYLADGFGPAVQDACDVFGVDWEGALKAARKDVPAEKKAALDPNVAPDVRCPERYCHQEPGKPCVSGSGKERGYAHATRLKAAAKKAATSVRCHFEGCKRPPTEGRAGSEENWRACEKHASHFKGQPAPAKKAKKGKAA